MVGGTSSSDHQLLDRLASRFLVISVVAAAIAALAHLRSAWESPGPRFLLIHADDAGLCAAANRATIAALEEGAVSSASIMVPCPGFEEFAEYARSHPEKDFGVHVTLTSEWDGLRWGPVSDPASVPSLICADGTFWQSADEFAGHAKRDDVENEIRAQIQLAEDRGIPLSHLDNHMNSLFRRPDLLELFVQISLDTGLPIRFAKTLPDGWDAVLSASVVDAYYEQLKVLYSHQNPLADFIEHDNYQAPPGEKRAYLLSVLRRLDAGVTELVVHCCDVGAGDWTPPDAPGRYAETMALRSPEFARELETLGITCIDWNAFRRMTQDSNRASW